MTITQQVSSTEGEKLDLMNSNCGNAASIRTQNGNLGLLMMQSDLCSDTASGSVTLLRTSCYVKGFCLSSFLPRQH